MTEAADIDPAQLVWERRRWHGPTRHSGWKDHANRHVGKGQHPSTRAYRAVLHPSQKATLPDINTTCIQSCCLVSWPGHAEVVASSRAWQGVLPPTLAVPPGLGLVHCHRRNHGPSRLAVCALPVAQAGGSTAGWPQHRVPAGLCEAQEMDPQAARSQRQANRQGQWSMLTACPTATLLLAVSLCSDSLSPLLTFTSGLEAVQLVHWEGLITALEIISYGLLQKGAVQLLTPPELLARQQDALRKYCEGVAEVFSILAALDSSTSFKSLAAALLDPVALSTVSC
ncbi:hypothetical protein HaLaN_05468 [Haematococcus lacustris]|uniref:Uncharacterized protein n=1 Tax=Haematococcus lacustris TaxID=44745 RepID=A0A699YJ03_HAELA|nr:hypothetical protein HaLaN_05468 [Haematococcus lacustris]